MKVRILLSYEKRTWTLEGDEKETEVGGGDEWRGFDTKVRIIMNEVGRGGTRGSCFSNPTPCRTLARLGLERGLGEGPPTMHGLRTGCRAASHSPTGPPGKDRETLAYMIVVGQCDYKRL